MIFFFTWKSVSELYFPELNRGPCNEAELIIIDEYLDYLALRSKW